MSHQPTKFTVPPPPQTYTLISFPSPHVLLVTLNRPASLNCINNAGHVELHALWEWFDAEPSLRVAVITGKGRAFCAGQDLKATTTSIRSRGSTPRPRASRGSRDGRARSPSSRPSTGRAWAAARS
ncbi:hypothetical protein VTN02DRAFT_2267 [Thermoascus thermophilus]